MEQEDAVRIPPNFCLPRTSSTSILGDSSMQGPPRTMQDVNVFLDKVRSFQRSLCLASDRTEVWTRFAEFAINHIPYIPGAARLSQRILNEALQTLPILKHNLIWKLYLRFATIVGGPASVRVWLRYIRVKPEEAEECAMQLPSLCPEAKGVAARILLQLLANSLYESTTGKTRFELSIMLCDLLCEDTARLAEIELDEVSSLGSKVQRDLRRIAARSLVQRRSRSLTASAIGSATGLDPISTVSATTTSHAAMVIRSLIYRYRDQVALLWNRLAQLYVVQRDFEQARGIYEEAIRSVTTVQDFAVLFDAYTNMEEQLVADQMALLEKKQQHSKDNNQNDEYDDANYENVTEESVDMLLDRLEWLLARRSFLVSDVILRQNPSNIEEWINRVKLHLEDGKGDSFAEQRAVQVFEKAVETVRYNVLRSAEIITLWSAFSNFFESRNDTESALAVLERGAQVIGSTYNADALTELIILRCELLKKHGNNTKIVSILLEATTVPQRYAGKAGIASVKYTDLGILACYRLFKSIRIWDMYAKIEEEKCNALLDQRRADAADNAAEQRLQPEESSKSKLFVYLTSEEIKDLRAVYERIIEIRIATIETMLKYGALLEKYGWISDSFQVYERTVSMFDYPVVMEAWNVYIPKFVKHSLSKSVTQADGQAPSLSKMDLERARDLFEQALANCPEELSSKLYIQFSEFEFRFGSKQRGLSVLTTALEKVQVLDRANIVDILLAKTYKVHGAASLRDVYQKAITILPDVQAPEYCVQFAELEVKLADLDRARKILNYGAEMVNPTTSKFGQKLFNSQPQTQKFWVSSASQKRARPDEVEVTDSSPATKVTKGKQFSGLVMMPGEDDESPTTSSMAAAANRANNGPKHASLTTSVGKKEEENRNVWDVWHEFETKHGDSTTMRNFVRVLRATQAKFT